MVGLGTLINAGTIVVGGVLGLFIGKAFREPWQETLRKCCGIGSMLLATAGVMEEMLSGTVADGMVTLTSGKALLLVLCLTLGGLLGELMNIEGKFSRFGEWLKRKTGNQGDSQFLDGFINTSLTVCIGAMAIVGAIQDGLFGDFSLLATKAVLDFVTVMIMTCSLGKGCIYSAVPVVILQGGVTAVSQLLAPIMTQAALANLSMVGSALIFCVGLNLVFGKTIRVANLLPALVVAVAAAFLPFSILT